MRAVWCATAGNVQLFEGGGAGWVQARHSPLRIDAYHTIIFITCGKKAVVLFVRGAYGGPCLPLTLARRDVCRHLCGGPVRRFPAPTVSRHSLSRCFATLTVSHAAHVGGWHPISTACGSRQAAHSLASRLPCCPDPTRQAVPLGRMGSSHNSIAVKFW